MINQNIDAGIKHRFISNKSQNQSLSVEKKINRSRHQNKMLAEQYYDSKKRYKPIEPSCELQAWRMRRTTKTIYKLGAKQGCHLACETEGMTIGNKARKW